MRRTHRANHDHVNRSLLHISNSHLNSVKTHLEILKDTVVEINNNEIGDAADGLRCFVYGHDEPNGKARSLFLDSSHNLKVKDDDILTEATSTNTKLDTTNSHLEILKDTVVEINNNEIGDAQDGLRCFVYGHDEPNSKARALFMDSSHNLKVKDDDLLTKATELDTAVDLSNTHLSSIDTRLDNTIGAINNSGSIGDGQSKMLSIMLGYDRLNGKGRSVLVDSDGKVEVSNADVETSLATIDTAVDLNNSRGDELYMDTHVAQISNGAIAQWALMSASGGSEIDMVASTGYQYRSVTIYGKTSTATARLHFAGSNSSGGTFYINPTYATLQVDNSSNYHFIMTWENCPFRYVDVIASVASAGLYLNTIKSKHR